MRPLLAAALAVGLAGPAAAQPPVLSAPAPAVRSPDALRLPARPGSLVQPGVLGPPLMDGWTPMTGFPVRGASVFDSRTVVVATQDGRLRRAELNWQRGFGPDKPPMNDADWVDLGATGVLSAPDCREIDDSSTSQAEAFCVWLAAGQSVRGAFLSTITTGPRLIGVSDLGGWSAVGRPAASFDARYSWNAPASRADAEYGVFAWNGSSLLGRRERMRRMVQQQDAGALYPTYEDGWTPLSGGFRSPVGCINSAQAWCADMAPDGSVRLWSFRGRPFYNQDPSVAPQLIAASAPLPGGGSGTAPQLVRERGGGATGLVVARSGSGRVWYARVTGAGPGATTIGPWQDFGGGGDPSVGVACGLYDWPSCVIVGPDRRLYWRQLNWPPH